MKREIRYTVIKDYIHETIGNCQDMYPIIYGSEDEAATCKARLDAGGDKSWFDPGGPEQGFLYVDQIAL